MHHYLVITITFREELTCQDHLVQSQNLFLDKSYKLYLMNPMKRAMIQKKSLKMEDFLRDINIKKNIEL